MNDSSDESDHVEEESENQRQRRASIRAIMLDLSLTPLKRRKSIQSLMDGRRRSSIALNTRSITTNGVYGSEIDTRRSNNGVGGLADAAAEVAKWFEDDDDDDDDEVNSSVGVNSQGNGYDIDNNGCSRRKSVCRRSSNLGHVLEDKILEDENGIEKELLDIEPPENANEEWYQSMRMERNRPECTHYDRNCTIISPCCGQAFGCRICHDECPILPPPFFLRSVQKKAQCVIINDNNYDRKIISNKEEQAKCVIIDDNNTSPTTDTAAATTTDAPTRRALSDEIMVDSATTDIDSHRRASLPSIFSKSLAISDEDEDFHHTIDRFAIKEIICRKCYTKQSSKTNFCINCGVQFGKYQCDICNLWMSDEEDPYHCDECGFCRVGGSENFKHCMDCGMCIDVELFHDHNCKSGKYMSNCPVCQEDLFSSRDASHEMPCGHAIHWHCFEELTSFDSRCPICKKTAETPEQMAPTWQAMAMSIAIQPVPLELTKVVSITCNDCEQNDTNRQWHFLGVQCKFCTSFNTNVDEILKVGQDAVDFLGIDDQELEYARETFATLMEDNDEEDDHNENHDLHTYYQYQQQQQLPSTESNSLNSHDDDDRNATQHNLQQFLMSTTNNSNNNSNLASNTANAFSYEEDEEQSENED